ncbi:MAG: DNA translocase FtsK 4TM domain-containing protein, partial [Burkholderiaceae bacterium]|nr:DNA translocase FtsK 4TM domain-containing protein [Burkholderiaceae bacterium]
MSFPLGSLRGEGAGESVAASARAAAPSVPWRRKAWLFVGGLAWLLWLLAMVTHDAADPAFTTSGGSEAVQNRVGVLGARVADLAYFLFGFSCWWLLPVGLRAWLSSLAAVLRHDAPAPVTPRWRFWLGLVLLLAASCALEWTRLYRFEAHLNGHAGGVLGWALGPLSMRWLGFAGSGVLWIALGVAGASMALRFSWLGVAETIGRRFDALRERLQGRREQAEDRRLGEMAAREREQQVEVEKRREDAEPAPLVIAPPAPEIPKSQRVARERQQPLFAELADNKLPQVDLLDAVPAAGREPSVTAESLEMTSRLIEKKLRDFGVEVHVVAASPGPVITRYEIEPATGVKGAQIVNLARDLARSLSLVSIRVV